MVAIKKHTPSNTTIIVVDDNSPDGTAKKYNHLLILTNPTGAPNSYFALHIAG